MESVVFKYFFSKKLAGIFGWFFVFAVLVGFDQIAKFLVFREEWFFSLLSIGESYILGFQRYLNYGFVFSLPMPVVLMFVIYFLVGVFLLIYLWKNWNGFSGLMRFSWILIVAGGVSNVLERLVLGYVRDFIYFYGGLIINLADLYIFFGAIVICLIVRKAVAIS
jgi:signal peptidase II